MSGTHFRTIALTLVLPLVSGSLAAQSSRYTLTGSDVAVYNLVGQMRVEAGTGSSVVVEVTRGGADASRLEVTSGPLAGRETLRVIYPGNRIVYAPMGRHSQTRLRVLDDGTFEDRSGHEITMSGDGDGLDAHADLRIMVPAGQRIAVNAGVGRVTVTNVDGHLSIDASSADVDASGTAGALNMDVGSGDIRISEARGDVTLESGSGDITLTRLQAGEVGIETGSGNVTATGLGATRLKVETGSGDVELHGVSSADVSVETGSGNIMTEVDASLRGFHGETGSGDVTIHAPASLSAELDIETSSGDITSEFAVAVTRRERDRLIGRIGDGRGKLSIDAGSGDVRLLKD